MIINNVKIFLLDDEKEIINMIESALRKEGYENIFSANNITTAEKAVYISVFIIIERCYSMCFSVGINFF